jgi:hypothetical protein
MNTELRIVKHEDGEVKVDAHHDVLYNADPDEDNPLAALVSGVDTTDKKVVIEVRTRDLTYAELAVNAIKNALGQ